MAPHGPCSGPPVVEALEHRALLCIGAPVAELTPDDLKKLMPRSDVTQAYASSCGLKLKVFKYSRGVNALIKLQEH